MKVNIEKAVASTPHSAQNIDEFCKSHRISRVSVYKEINSGRLRSMKVGRRRIISLEAAADWRKLCEVQA